ncbi:hypothetical protein J4463_01130 [Candidatus Pacearchaeota archaeon]|nr:hypothetical protein [Candidatus Pacearchaeota archaeon]
MKFVHKVSKGSRFNQIYIPKEFENHFEVGDLVQVELLEKNTKLYYSKKIELSSFKKRIIQEIFSCLNNLKSISQIFVFGSFITKKADYNDIDLIIISDIITEKQVYTLLLEKLELKFHILMIPESKLKELEKICPLTRSMLYYSISNKPFFLEKERVIDKNHINFLLMMPEDILKLNVDGKTIYNALRRLETIENFLNNKEENPRKIEKDVEKLIGEKISCKLKENTPLAQEETKRLNEIIKSKLVKIRKK